MAKTAKKCPDCGGEMVEGFLFTHGAEPVPRWVKGSPEKSAWAIVKAKGKECRSVETYRCAKCGLLRSYANTEVDPPSIWSQ